MRPEVHKESARHNPRLGDIPRKLANGAVTRCVCPSSTGDDDAEHCARFLPDEVKEGKPFVEPEKVCACSARLSTKGTPLLFCWCCVDF